MVEKLFEIYDMNLTDQERHLKFRKIGHALLADRDRLARAFEEYIEKFEGLEGARFLREHQDQFLDRVKKAIETLLQASWNEDEF